MVKILLSQLTETTVYW